MSTREGAVGLSGDPEKETGAPWLLSGRGDCPPCLRRKTPGPFAKHHFPRGWRARFDLVAPCCCGVPFPGVASGWANARGSCLVVLGIDFDAGEPDQETKGARDE